MYNENEETYPEIGGVYNHYKGGQYKVLSLATHTETKEVLVMYQSVHHGTVFARPLDIWMSKAQVNRGIDAYSEMVQRFKKV